MILLLWCFWADVRDLLPKVGMCGVMGFAWSWICVAILFGWGNLMHYQLMVYTEPNNFEHEGGLKDSYMC